MTSKFVVTDESQPIQPSASYPFVVLTRGGQPVGLIALNPFAVNNPPPGSKTAAILVIPPEKALSAEDDPEVLAEAYVILQEAIDAEGVILVNDHDQVIGVLPTEDILAPGDENTQKEIYSYLRDRSQPKGSNYQPLAGKEPRVTVSVIYSCPEVGCSSPDINLWQKGHEIPDCPIHNKPRQPKKVEVINRVD